MKMPAFQFYPADWRKDPGVQALSRHDRSVWFDILCIMHESDERGVLLLAGRPMPDAALGAILGLDNQTLNQTLTTLLTYGVASRREGDGAIYSRRMVRDEKLCQTRREAGKKGGNPDLVNQKPKQKPTTQDKQIPTPSSSTSSSIPSNDGSAGEASSEGLPEEVEVSTPSANLTPQPRSSVREMALAHSDPEDEQLWSVGPLVKPDAFRAICDRLGYEGIAYERYRKQALVAAEDGKVSRTIQQWSSWIRNFLRNQERNGPLVKQAADLPTEPTPKHELPAPGKERKGQVIAIEGVPYDESMNRMKVAAYQKHYPTAIIHAIR